MATPCTERSFDQIAQDWGYGARVRAAASNDRVLAEGNILSWQTSSGLRLCASDIVGTRNHVRCATLGRSLTVYAMSDGPALQWRYGLRTQLRAGQARAAALAVHDDASLTERQQIGQRSRCLVIQATPDTLADSHLAEQVNGLLRATQAQALTGLDRLSQLSAELLATDADMTVARLLLESCALEMLARAFQGLQGLHSAACALSAMDRQRMQRVRDMLMADPGLPHTLAGLAREAGVSVTTLKEKFPLLTGCPVFEYLRELRLDRAHAGLRADGWTVKQAAYYAGYRHASNFSTAYRRRFGVAPSQH